MIKKMIKEEKGFTLVELLAVIVILGIIVAIAIPAIGNVIDNAGKKADDAEETLIIDAARLYEIEDGHSLPVTIQTLIDTGYLEERQSELTPHLSKQVIRENGDLKIDPALK